VPWARRGFWEHSSWILRTRELSNEFHRTVLVRNLWTHINESYDYEQQTYPECRIAGSHHNLEIWARHNETRESHASVMYMNVEDVVADLPLRP
jgi:hypothetical protein